MEAPKTKTTTTSVINLKRREWGGVRFTNNKRERKRVLFLCRRIDDNLKIIQFWEVFT